MERIIIGIAVLTIISCIIGTLGFVKNMWHKYCDKKAFFGVFAASVLICMAGYVSMVLSDHYSVDSFNRLFDASPYWEAAIGRYFNCGVILLALKFGINQVVFQRIFMALWIITMAIMFVMITESITRYMQNMDLRKWMLVLAAVSVSFINIFAMDLMLFPETAMEFIMANLALGLSVYFGSGDMKPVPKWMLCALFLAITISSYQSYIGIFESFVLTGIYFKWRKNPKMRYFESFMSLVIGGMVCISDVLLMKIFVHLGLIGDSGRGATFQLSEIKDNILQLLSYQARFWKDADGFLPDGLMPILGAVLICVLIYAGRALNDAEQKIFLIALILGCYILGFAAHIIEKNFLLSPRSNIAVWAALGIVFIVGIGLIEEDAGRIFGSVLEGMLVLLLVSNVCIMSDMAANEQAINAIDLTEAGLIADKVYEYESETGNIVGKVATTGDTDCTYYHEKSRYQNAELGARILSTPYSNYRLIGHVMGRSMERIDMSEDVYTEYFAGKNWSGLKLEEQAVCIGDTLYLAIY